MFRSAGRFRAALCAASVLVLGALAPSAFAQTAPDHSQGGCGVQRPAARAGRRVLVQRQLLRPDPALRRADPEAGQRHGGGPAAVLQEERLRPRRPGGAEHPHLPGPARASSITRDSFSVPHIEAEQPRRRDVRGRLRHGRGPHAADGHAAQPRPGGGDRRAGAQPVRAGADASSPSTRPSRPRTSSRSRSTWCWRSRAGSGSSTTSTTTSRASTTTARSAGTTGRPWNRNDVIAVAALIGAVFGKGGGDEARRSQLLSALQDRLGRAARASRSGTTCASRTTPETAVTLDRQFRLTHPRPNQKGNAVDRRGQPRHAAAAGSGGQRRQASSAREQRGARRRGAIGHRAPVLRGGTAGRLLLPADPVRGRRARRRHRRARRDVPRIRALRGARPRAGLLVERDLRGQRQHRHLRRGAVRRRHALPASKASAAR